MTPTSPPPTLAVGSTLPPGAIPPPPGTAGPGYTPPPAATLASNVLTELPAGASDALGAFAASQGTTSAGECTSAAQTGQLCYSRLDSTPTLEGSAIHVRLRVVGQLLAYDVDLALDASGLYHVVSSSGPTPFSIPPP